VGKKLNVCEKVTHGPPTHGLGEFGGNYSRQRCLDVLRQVAHNLVSETLSVRSFAQYLAHRLTFVIWLPTSSVHPLVCLWYRLDLISHTVPPRPFPGNGAAWGGEIARGGEYCEPLNCLDAQGPCVSALTLAVTFYKDAHTVHKSQT
jgi:hypothetical protein